MWNKADILPEEGKEVLCYYKYYHWKAGAVLPEYGIGYVYRGQWCGDVSGGDATVIAWMPLPKCDME